MSPTKRVKLTLMDILNAANQHYDERYLSTYFDVRNQARRSGSGDTLAEFIVRELNETFNGRTSRERQVATAVRALERAKDDIQNAIEGLQNLDPE